MFTLVEQIQAIRQESPRSSTPEKVISTPPRPLMVHQEVQTDPPPKPFLPIQPKVTTTTVDPVSTAPVNHATHKSSPVKPSPLKAFLTTNPNHPPRPAKRLKLDSEEPSSTSLPSSTSMPSSDSAKISREQELHQDKSHRRPSVESSGDEHGKHKSKHKEKKEKPKEDPREESKEKAIREKEKEKEKEAIREMEKEKEREREREREKEREKEQERERERVKNKDKEKSKKSKQREERRQSVETDPGDLSFSPTTSPVKYVSTSTSTSTKSSSPPQQPNPPRKRKNSVADEKAHQFEGVEDVQSASAPNYPRYFSYEKKEKAFPRKPRSLELNWSKSSEHRNMFAASCLDGSVQFWSFTQQRQLFSIPGEKLHGKWVEDMCWTRDGNSLALAFPEDASKPNAKQLGLLHLTTQQGKTKIKIDIQDFTPHEGGINSIAALKDLRFVTGGNDKALVHWDLTDSDQPKVWIGLSFSPPFLFLIFFFFFLFFLDYPFPEETHLRGPVGSSLRKI